MTWMDKNMDGRGGYYILSKVKSEREKQILLEFYVDYKK